MDRKDALIVFLIMAAFVALVAIPWRQIVPTGMEAAPIVPDPAPGGAIGPASAWANVPVQRFVTAPHVGGYMSGRGTVDTGMMYGCEKGC